MSTQSSVPHPADETVDPAAAPGRRRVRRTLLAGGVVALGAAGLVAWNLPTDLNTEQPGPILDLAARVHVDDPAATAINGAFNGLTVQIRPMSVGDRVLHAVTHDPATVISDRQLRPPDVPAGTYHKLQKSAYVDGGQIAAAVAEKALGREVTVTTTGLAVQEVLAGSPAAAVLHVGDVITAVDGSPATSGEQLAAAVQGAGERPMILSVEGVSSSTARDVTVTPARSGDDDRLRLGVGVDLADVHVELAVPVIVDASGVEGPSAGLMTGLTVYDELSPTDLAAGRHIAGTGTLAIDGTVGEIGGIEAKARAAAAAGADLFLAPASQAADARAVLGSRIPVVGISTFSQALDVLGGEASVPASAA